MTRRQQAGRARARAGSRVLLPAACLCLTSGLARADALDDWHWRAPLPQGNSILGIVAAEGQVVAVGDSGTVLTSTNGVDWTLRDSGTREALQGVTRAGGEYVAVGTAGLVLVADSDESWRSAWTPPVEQGGNDVAFGHELFVVAGGGGVLWTGRKDGSLIPRSPIQLAGSDLLAVDFADGRFAVAGTRGMVGVSSNGLDWTRIVFEDACLAEGKIVLVASGERGLTLGGAG